MRKCYHIIEKEKYGELYFHGIYQFSDGDEAGPVVVAENKNGHLDTFDPSNIVFLDPPAEDKPAGTSVNKQSTPLCACGKVAVSFLCEDCVEAAIVD
jgi:hypothetical protein